MPNFNVILYTDREIVSKIFDSLYAIFTDLKKQTSLNYSELHGIWLHDDAVWLDDQTTIRSLTYNMLMEDLLPVMRAQQRYDILEEYWKISAEYILEMLSEKMLNKKESKRVILNAYSLHTQDMELEKLVEKVNALLLKLDDVIARFEDLKDDVILDCMHGRKFKY